MSTRRAVPALAAILITAVAAGGCGESAEEKAQAQVCDARAGIEKEVKALGALTPATVTADAVTQGVESIRADLKEIREARGELSEDRRSDLRDANAAFTASVREVGATVLRSQSVEEARTQLTAAADSLAATYRSTLGTFDCS